MRRFILAIALAGLQLVPTALPAIAQNWSGVDALLAGTLTNSGRSEAAFWLPDQLDPATATQALGVVYEHIPGSAGSVSLAAALYRKTDAGWAVSRRVEGLFGHSPRDHRFLSDRIELTTTTLGPGEPRCCPTLPVRWFVSLETGKAQRVE